MKVELAITRESNGVLGNYYAVSAWQGEAYLGREIYAGYTRAQARGRAMDTVALYGGLGLYRGIITAK
jgi:hypothetical protein